MSNNKYICKICWQNNINIIIKPCGHTMCKMCINNIKKNCCPYCRADIDTYSNMCFMIHGHTNGITCIEWSHDSIKIASGSMDNTIRITNLNNKDYNIYKGHNDFVTSIAWSPDGYKLASGSLDNTIHIIDISRNEQINIYNHNDNISSVCWSPDGKMICFGSYDMIVYIWNINDDSIYKIKGHTNSVKSVSWSQNGRMIASGSDDSKIMIWNVENEDITKAKCIYILHGHIGSVFSVSWSPDSKKLASGSFDTNIGIWLWKEPCNILPINENIYLEKGDNNEFHHVKDVTSISWLHDNQHIVSGSLDMRTCIWYISESKKMIPICEEIYVNHNNIITSVSWSKEGKYIASGSWDGIISIIKRNMYECNKCNKNVIEYILDNNELLCNECCKDIKDIYKYIIRIV